MSQDSSRVKTLAQLARIDVTADEARHLTEQLPKIIAYVGQLAQVKTSDQHTDRPASKPNRDDVVQPSPSVEAILAQAPDRLEHWWRVTGVFS